MTIRAILIDDRPLLRRGVRAVLEENADVEVVAEGEDGNDALRLVEALAPDIVVMDVAMPGMGGIEATRRLRAAGAAARVIALSMHDDRGYVEGMLAEGAAGYVLKDCAAEELLPAMRAALAGETYLGSGLPPDLKVRAG